ncbi:MAG: YhjD/YihY/BrkB family envelope integrity protein [Opitutaceae bacterium]
MKPPPPAPPADLRKGPAWLARIAHLWHTGIWEPATLSDRSLRGRGLAVLRVISITLTVFQETRVVSRAAALSFTSLLSLGPLVAISVLAGGFALGQQDNQLLTHHISTLLANVAPQLQSLSGEAGATGAAGDVNPELRRIVDGFVQSARSGYGGAFGALTLIFIVLMMFKSIEDAFNDLWGINQGRSLLIRVVFYWTILTLGAVLFFAAVALLGAGAAVNVFHESLARLPGGERLVAALGWSLPVFSLSLLTLMLTLVYRVVPNTPVLWRAAFAGGAVVALLLLLNNVVAFLYVRRVVLTQNLYGQLAVPLVLVLGLYVFWLYVLIGGVISYAVQNVHFRNSQTAWSRLTEAMRERLSLAVLLTIGRRFRACEPPVTAAELGRRLRVPRQILNECLHRLGAMGLVHPLRAAPGRPATELRFQPARPLDRMTLFDFKRLDDQLGDDPVGHSLESVDPLMHAYEEALGRFSEQPFFQRSLDDLLGAYPFPPPPAAIRPAQPELRPCQPPPPN